MWDASPILVSARGGRVLGLAPWGRSELQGPALLGSKVQEASPTLGFPSVHHHAGPVFVPGRTGPQSPCIGAPVGCPAAEQVGGRPEVPGWGQEPAGRVCGTMTTPESRCVSRVLLCSDPALGGEPLQRSQPGDGAPPELCRPIVLLQGRNPSSADLDHQEPRTASWPTALPVVTPTKIIIAAFKALSLSLSPTALGPVLPAPQ